MKKAAFIFSGLFFSGIMFKALPLQALQFSIVGPCSSKPTFQTEIPVKSELQSLGDFTLQVLADNQIPFRGDRNGVQAIQNSPVGDEALEILSDFQMRAYGWCVSIDGRQPDRMPDEIMVSSQVKEIIWFYAYAFYDRGVWKNFCTPSHQVQPSQVCPSTLYKPKLGSSISLDRFSIQ